MLKPGGILRLAVPDFKAICEVYSESKSIEEIKGLVCGGQKDEYDHHYNVFDEKSLTSLLIDAGFTTVKFWDWQATDHAHFDDYSQSYLPHMDKVNGKLMSLNLQGIK